MKKLLNISAIINFIVAGIVGAAQVPEMLSYNRYYSYYNYGYKYSIFDYISMQYIIMAVFLIIAGVIYLKYAKLDIEMVAKKRVVLIILAVISIVYNFVSALFVFIAVSKIDDEYKKYVAEGGNTSGSIKPKEKVSKEVKRLDFMLKLGVVLVGISGLIFATTSWQSTPDVVKVIALILFGLVFIALSRFTEVKLKLKTSSVVYWLLGMLFFVFSTVSVGYFEIFGSWLSPYGDGSDMYYTMVTGIASVLALISYAKFKYISFMYIAYTAITFAIYNFISYFGVNLEINLLILISTITVINIFNNSEKVELVALRTFIKAATYGITTVIIFNNIAISEVNVPILVAGALVSSIGLIYISIREDEPVTGIFAPIFVNVLATVSVLKIDMDYETKIITLVAVYNFVLLILNLTKLSLKNRTFNVSVQAVNMLSQIVPILVATAFYQETVMIVASIMILTHLILLLFKDILKLELIVEEYIQPLKVLLFLVASFVWINKVGFEVNVQYAMVIYAVVFLLLHLVTKKDILKYIYYIVFILFGVSGLVSNLDYEKVKLVSLIQLPLLFVPFVIAKLRNDKKYNVLKIPTLIIFLLSTHAIITEINPFRISDDLAAAMISMLMYLVIYAIYFKDKVLSTIIAVTAIVPYLSIMECISIDSDLQSILTVTVLLLLLFMFCTNVIKSVKARNIVSAIFSTIFLVSIMFTSSLIIGLYVGIVAVLLIILGFVKRNYRSLFVVGIVITIINIIYQLIEFWSKVPFWLYLLIAGLTLIGIVTRKELKKLPKE